MQKKQVNRTRETHARYDEERKVVKTDTIDEQREVFAEYTHWRIVENKYPYDAVFSTHHMLVSKRLFPNLTYATKEETAELNEIKEELATEQKYHGILENFPTNVSKPGHCHLHLFVWKYYDEDNA